MRVRKKNNLGFTLIELVVSLAILGLIGFGAGTFLLYAAKGYMLTKANIEAFQKTSIAMDRLIKEIKNADEIYEISSGSIRYQRDGQAFGIALVGNNIRIIRANAIPDSGSGSILVDNISDFTLTFEDIDGNPWTVPADFRLTDLSRITLQMTIDIEETSKTFAIETNPLYNDMVNGPTS